MRSPVLNRYLDFLCRWAIFRFLRNAINSTDREIRRHGWGGVGRRLPFYVRNFRKHLVTLTRRPPAGEAHLFNAESARPRHIRPHPEFIDTEKFIDATVSIVIPTLNAGFEFHWLLRKLRAQRGLRELEIVIVDSGSSDDTVPLARAAGCTVVEIAPADFSHSFARNRGADAARGDYFLFIVQDAYPIGDYWVYGMLTYLLDHAEGRMGAVSCSEYSRSDSDLIYDWMMETHHRFLGCRDYDRIGRYHGEDHTLLRSYGHLSDVACLIGRPLFQKYRYRGSYAEDLDLGVRLIKDGYQVAMLASVKVVHSHNRSVYYYLKRCFVDTVFLVDIFEDYVYPSISSVNGLIVGIVSSSAHLSDWLETFDPSDCDRTVAKELEGWMKDWKPRFAELRLDAPCRLPDEKFNAYINSLAQRYLSADKAVDRTAAWEATIFMDGFFARIEHFGTFAGRVYQEQDSKLKQGLRDAVLKSFAASVGSTLGYMYTDLKTTTGAGRDMVETIKSELKAGI